MIVIVQRGASSSTYEQLRAYFSADPRLVVVRERRGLERRKPANRRARAQERAREQRRIRGSLGRRVAERRARVARVPGPGLPPGLERWIDQLIFVQRVERSPLIAEDADTAVLVIRFQSGETDAFTLLYTRYVARIYAYVHSLLGDRHDAESVTHDVFVRALGSLPAFELRGPPFRSWLFRIARNCAVDAVVCREQALPTDPQVLIRAIERRHHHDDAAELAIDIGELFDALAHLSAEQRTALLLRDLVGLDSAEVAAATGRSPAAVRQHQSRGSRLMQAELSLRGSGGQPPR